MVVMHHAPIRCSGVQVVQLRQLSLPRMAGVRWHNAHPKHYTAPTRCVGITLSCSIFRPMARCSLPRSPSDKSCGCTCCTRPVSDCALLADSKGAPYLEHGVIRSKRLRYRALRRIHRLVEVRGFGVLLHTHDRAESARGQEGGDVQGSAGF
jgi:3'-phosphoadenosine 5'-phosphosulfate sulfotransferase (PAPS reductase)/FAD synthetase